MNGRFWGKADIAFAWPNFRLWPKADIRRHFRSTGARLSSQLPPRPTGLSPKAWQSSSGHIHVCRKARAMSEQPDDQDRPCLHCMMVELIDEFFAEHPAAGGEPGTIDTDEVVTAIAKTVAELTCSQDGSIRQQIIEKLMREIMDTMRSFVETTEQERSVLMHGTNELACLDGQPAFPTSTNSPPNLFDLRALSPVAERTPAVTNHS